MPPAALTSSIACSAPLLSCAPNAALPPVIGPAMPILMPPRITSGGNPLGLGAGGDVGTATVVEDGAVGRGGGVATGAAECAGAGGAGELVVAAICFLMASMRALA